MTETSTPGLAGFDALRYLRLGELAPYVIPADEPAPSRGAPTVPDAAGGPLCSAVSGLAGFSTSALDLVSAAERTIAATEPVIRAWSYLDVMAARSQAAEAPGHDPAELPLAGVLVGVKDLVDVAGMPTRASSRQLSAASPALIDSPIVAWLRAAGAVIAGKCNTHEYAFGGTTPPTTNPADPLRIPGGSSGGSAAAVAGGHVPLAVGTDTAGSVRIPAAYCGVVGLLPSPGVIPLRGVVPLSWSLDRVGLMTSTAADMVYVASALGLAQPLGHRLDGLRVGVLANAFEPPVQPAVEAAVRAAIAAIESAGATVRTVRVPHDYMSVPCSMAIMVAESAEYHRERLKRPELFGGDVRASLALSEHLPAVDLVRAQRVRELIAREWQSVFAEVDLVAGPTMPLTAPTIADAATGVLNIDGADIPLIEAHLRYPVAANLAGLPSASQPCGRDECGLPIGLQWLAARGDDDLITQALLGYEGTYGKRAFRSHAGRSQVG